MRLDSSLERLVMDQAVWDRAEASVELTVRPRHGLHLECYCRTPVSPIEEESFVWCPQCGAVFDAAGWRS